MTECSGALGRNVNAVARRSGIDALHTSCEQLLMAATGRWRTRAAEASAFTLWSVKEQQSPAVDLNVTFFSDQDLKKKQTTVRIL